MVTPYGRGSEKHRSESRRQIGYSRKECSHARQYWRWSWCGPPQAAELIASLRSKNV